MAKLTDEMKEMLGKQLAIIATANNDGTPNVGPKGSMRVIDDETLAYSEGTGEKTFRNLIKNPKVAVIVVDRQKLDGYQIKGMAELLTAGDLYEQVAKWTQERGRPRPAHVVKIKVEETYSVRPGKTARRIT